jgi:hypothetical protein
MRARVCGRRRSVGACRERMKCGNEWRDAIVLLELILAACSMGSGGVKIFGGFRVCGPCEGVLLALIAIHLVRQQLIVSTIHLILANSEPSHKLM